MTINKVWFREVLLLYMYLPFMKPDCFNIITVFIGTLKILTFTLGHPNKMFRFPSPSDSKRLVGRSEKKKIKIRKIF